MTEPKKLSAERLEEIDKQWGYCSHFEWSRELLDHISFQASRIAELEAGIQKIQGHTSFQSSGYAREIFMLGDKLLSPKDTQGE